MSRLLLVEAEASDRLVLKSRLTEAGYKVTSVETGAKGIVEARTGDFDLLVISAEGRGGVDGCEVCRRVKAIPELVHVPIIVYSTGKSGSDMAEAAYAAGADAFVSKGQMPHIHLVLEAQMRHRSRVREALDQSRILEQENQRLEAQQRHMVDIGSANLEETNRAVLLRELACGRPDGVMVVDSSGHVQNADRGALELMGRSVIGQALGKAAPATGLEAFVRDARATSRDGFRFEVSQRKDRSQRNLMAAVVPVTRNESSGQTLRIVLLLDLGKRKVAEEMLRAHEPGIPRQQLAELLDAAASLYTLEAITGRGEATTALREQVSKYISRQTPALISGPKGSGKRHVANVLHYSGQATGPILSLRCGSQSSEELELELFGYMKGSFPDAMVDHPGLMLLAQDGTLLLEDVDHLSKPLQARIAQAMADRKLMRKGARQPERFELRLLATTQLSPEAFETNSDVDPAFAKMFHGRSVNVPSLVERRDDLPILVEFFLERFGPLHKVSEVSDEASWVLAHHDWPGNVAELESSLEEACSQASGQAIQVEHLPAQLRQLVTSMPAQDIIPSQSPSDAHDYSGLPQMTIPGMPAFEEQRPWDIGEEDPISLEHYEMKALLRALDSCGGDKLAAARLLKVGKSTLYRKLKRFGIS
ncbi:MAG: sigma 54-interacting transcriptional regulator [Planctomycetes bacterium]|nr:sigma 54-interacting transcriptional regulator [Planctomycetota bacterium]